MANSTVPVKGRVIGEEMLTDLFLKSGGNT